MRLLARLSLCFVAAASLRAQSTEIVPAVGPYEVETWTVGRGLPQSVVTAIQQSRDGRLWISTFGGLARFDGLRFEIFDLSTNPELRSNRIRCLCETRDGALWIGTESHGLVRFQDGEIRALDHDAGLPSDVVRSLLEDSEGRLWVGTQRGLVSISGDTTRTYQEPTMTVHGLAESASGVLWVASAEGLFRSNGDGFESVDTRNEYTAVLCCSDGSVWAGTGGDRVLRFRENQIDEFTLPSGTPVRAMTEDREGGVWFANERHPVRWYGGCFEDPLTAAGGTLPDPLPTRFGLAALADAEGNLWFGGSWGLCRMRPTPMSGVALQENYGVPPRTVGADASGRVWIALQNGVLLRLENGAITEVTGKSRPIAESMALASDGSLWTASEDGVWRVRDGHRVEPADIDLRGEQGKRWGLLEDRENALWVSCGGNLFRFAAGRRKRWTEQDGLPGGSILALLESRRGDVWVAADNGLCRVVGDHVARTWLSEDDLPAGAVRAIHEDASGQIWIGTYGGGVCRVPVEGIPDVVGTKAGLYEGVVSRIVSDGRGHLLLLGNRALSVIDEDGLAAVADGNQARLYPRVFNSGPEIDIFEGMGGANPLRCQTPDGALWFATAGGVVRFDPSVLEAAEPPAPTVLVESVFVNGRRYPGREQIVVSPGARDLVIEFTAPTFVDADRVLFEYRLDGYAEDWSTADTRRSAVYTRLPPGDYVFRVAALERNGTRSGRTTSIALQLRPWFWETVWFRVILTLLVVAMGASAIMYRTQRMRRRAGELESLVEVRTRELQREVGERRDAEEKLRDARDHLEDKVRLRTEELAEALDNLRADVARREELEHQLRDSQKFEALGRLAGGLAHDFNNILTAILAQSDIVLDSLAEAPPGDARREGLEVIRDAGERAARLTRQLLAYSRQQLLKPETISPNEAIADLEEMLRRLVREDTELRIRLDSHAGYVHVDPGQLGRVIVNLVVNASDATAGGGRIAIETLCASFDEDYVASHPDTVAGRYVCIAVTDTGEGIDLETIDHIFEPFFTTKAPGKGTGLGLASVHGIVKQSGGVIQVHSEPGVGTTFKVYLPEVERVAVLEPARPPLPASGGGATVLLCDDEPAIMRAASRLLENKGYRVLAAETPEHALELGCTHANEVDLLVTDLIMPGMRGTELAAKLRAILGELRVLYISGYSPDLLADDVEIDLAKQFLHKPFNSETLARRVAEMLVGS